MDVAIFEVAVGDAWSKLGTEAAVLVAGKTIAGGVENIEHAGVIIIRKRKLFGWGAGNGAEIPVTAAAPIVGFDGFPDGGSWTIGVVGGAGVFCDLTKRADEIRLGSAEPLAAVCWVDVI